MADSDLADRTAQAESSSTLNILAGSAAADKLKGDYRPNDVEDRLETEVLQLARQYTNRSNAHVNSLFPAARDGPLDPYGPRFDAKTWWKAFWNTRSADDHQPRTAGIAFKNLSVYGFGTDTDFQSSVGNAILKAMSLAQGFISARKQRVDILHDMVGLVSSGEMLAILGPPGSGCSTLLRTIAGDTHGFHISKGSSINYQGIRPEEMRTAFRGEAIYTAEVDDHFPMLTVADTLYFAARARAPKTIPGGVSKREYAEHIRDVTMAVFGISHTFNTRVGNDFIRGVSGGERKRVTIAEATLSYSPLQCWDNSTRGLDSANALEFCRTLRTQADVLGSTACVAIYQASQEAYKVFDKVTVLYDGHQIFFGRARDAKAYFEGLGFNCPDRQTTADFLTAMTSEQERVVRPGWEDRVPRNAEDFSVAWKQSDEYRRLTNEIDEYFEQHPFGGEHYHSFLDSRKMDQSASQREKSPYMISYAEQVRLCMWRGFKGLKSDPSITITRMAASLFEAIIVSSIFYNLPHDTTTFYRRGVLLFWIIIMNAFANILEILTLYEKRKVVEKHARYALCHPSADALAAMVVDMPYKIVNTILMNTILYFMCNLRRDPGHFFFFLLVSFLMGMSMSMLFRFLGSVTKSIAQALAPSTLVLLVLALYTGFAIPISYMRGWIGWVRYINPIQYGFESLMVNEFHDQNFTCQTFVPSGADYGNVGPFEGVCSTVGAVPGAASVNGDTYIAISFGYFNSHKWRNVGIIAAITIILMIFHLSAIEFIQSERSKGEVLVFTREALKRKMSKKSPNDEEAAGVAIPHGYKEPEAKEKAIEGVHKQTSVFHWQDVCYDITIKGQPRRILDHVDGWVKPGTLTALMGASGAGKTTLLDVLASRVTMGVITGEMLVDGQLRDESFQRKTGYVQQQDLHLATSTVREALEFSARLRQPAYVPDKEKIDYVNTVISLLNMDEYSEAVVGTPGEGLNVEQRKRLTIGVELVARPQLLLFLDEPTSGLDSQTSWSICNLMEKLKNSGQAVLCTIHQPSAILFQRFDRLILLAGGGKPVYFGEIGSNSDTLLEYFARNGGAPCPVDANPAEYMLHVIGAAPGSHTDIDWPAVWRQSSEYQQIREELDRLKAGEHKQQDQPGKLSVSDYDEFAAPFLVQVRQVTKRVIQQYWRTPSYIYSKAILTVGSSLFIGLSFLNGQNTRQGLQNQEFGVFMFLTMFPQLVEQIIPVFVSQRTLYEARERPSKSYSWVAFLLANIMVETMWTVCMTIFCFICWYYPIGLWRNALATGTVHSRGILAFLYILSFLIFSSTFSNMIIAGLGSQEIAGSITNLVVILMFAFCGILAGPDDLPGFWIFMYRVNPFTYIMDGLLSTSLANVDISCASNEYLNFQSPPDTTCSSYMASYIKSNGGYLLNPDDEKGATCQYCPISDSNTFLSSINSHFSNRWRNLGFMWIYIVFNIFAAVALYWLARVPKKKAKRTKESKGGGLKS